MTILPSESTGSMELPVILVFSMQYVVMAQAANIAAPSTITHNSTLTVIRIILSLNSPSMGIRNTPFVVASSVMADVGAPATIKAASICPSFKTQLT